MARRGSFLRGDEELVTINGAILSNYSQSMIVMEDRNPDVESSGYTIQDLSYVGNVYPPNYDININDLVTRYPRDSQHERGSSSGQLQVLTVESIEVVKGKQQLRMRDRDRVVR